MEESNDRNEKTSRVSVPRTRPGFEFTPREQPHSMINIIYNTYYYYFFIFVILCALTVVQKYASSFLSTGFVLGGVGVPPIATSLVVEIYTSKRQTFIAYVHVPV